MTNTQSQQKAQTHHQQTRIRDLHEVVQSIPELAILNQVSSLGVRLVVRRALALFELFTTMESELPQTYFSHSRMLRYTVQKPILHFAIPGVWELVTVNPPPTHAKTANSDPYSTLHRTMAFFQTCLGATCGVLNVFFVRGLMKQPAFFRPYEHVLGLGVGAYLGYSYHHWTIKQGEQLIGFLEKHDIDAQLIRYLLPRI